jgi:hypothetical protein
MAGHTSAGETYSLEVVLDGRLITGRATIPMRPQPVLVERGDGHREVQWPRIAAAGMYALEVDSDIIREHATRDTFYLDLPPKR